MIVAQRTDSHNFEKDSHIFTYGKERSLPYSIQQPLPEDIFVPAAKNNNIFSLKMENTAEITESSKLTTIMWLLLVRTITSESNSSEYPNYDIESCLDDGTESFSSYDESEMDRSHEVFEESSASINSETENVSIMSHDGIKLNLILFLELRRLVLVGFQFLTVQERFS